MNSSSDIQLRKFFAYLLLTSSYDPTLLLLLYFQVDTGVWYFLHHVENIYLVVFVASPQNP